MKIVTNDLTVYSAIAAHLATPVIELELDEQVEKTMIELTNEDIEEIVSFYHSGTGKILLKTIKNFF